MTRRSRAAPRLDRGAGEQIDEARFPRASNTPDSMLPMATKTDEPVVKPVFKGKGRVHGQRILGCNAAGH